MNATAIVLSPTPYTREWQFPVYNHVCGSGLNAEQLHHARLESLQGVATEWCFVLDSDDDLPDDHMEVLAQCESEATDADAHMAYTDELQIQDGIASLNVAGPYSAERYLQNNGIMHHLVLMRTVTALKIAEYLPRGRHITEIVLYYELAKAGCVYVPRVGYVWNRGTGMHSRADSVISAAHSHRWCYANPHRFTGSH